jgi:hypothetical protein
MNEVGWRRAGAGAGVLGAVVYVVSVFVAGTPLKPDDSIDLVVAHLADKRTAFLFGSLLALIAAGFLLWFLGYLRAFLARTEGDHAPLATVTGVAWVALLVIVIAGSAPLNALVWRGTDQADPKTVQLAFDINNLSLYALSATAVLLSVLAPMIVIWRWRALPRWLLVLGAAEIIANIVELGGLFSRTGANAAGYGDGVGPFLWVLWVAALSVTILMKETRADTASA